MVQESLDSGLDFLCEDYLRSDSQVADYKDYLQLTSNQLIEKFKLQAPIVELLHARSDSIDRLLTHLWKLHLGSFADQLSLIAVGGFGRGELHPHSDIDILILYPNKLSGFDEKLQLLIT